MNLEQQLRQALERKDPAAGFDGRVMSRVSAGKGAPAASHVRWSGLGVFLPVAARVHPQYRTPHLAIVALGGWASLLAL
jgi:hypothetical protein